MSTRPNRPSNQAPRGHARAPYNFVPLPDRVIPAEMIEDEQGNHHLPPHNTGIPGRNSGYFDVTLTAKTPLYIRGMLTIDETRQNKDKEQSGQKDAQVTQPEPYNIAGVPRLPGSSLRGMLRALVEIATFSKIQPVSDAYKFFFRAVAAENTDPLRDPYREMIGPLNRHVRAGYLARRGDDWQIRPAKRFGKEVFSKVKDHPDVIGGVRDLKRFNDPDYRVQVHPVQYDLGGKGFVQRVYSPPPGEKPSAYLVCTGNMLETNDGQTPSPRKRYALVSQADPDAQPLPIPQQVVRDYRDSLTPFVRDQFREHFQSEDGALIHGHPIFYIVDQGMVTAFGHTPNFRVPHLIWHGDEPHAVTLHDCLPSSVFSHEVVPYDYAEAMFGFVPVDDQDKERRGGGYAGRVSVTSAELTAVWRERFHENRDNVLEREFPPHILASPKPTTFQHYLEQPNGTRTHKPDLHHYGSEGAKIRGHKLYWRKRLASIQDIEQTDQAELESKKTQYTRIRPVRAGVAFTFRVYFDNLTDAELGALAWALTLDGDARAHHMLGMGKPHGLGIAKLAARLMLCDRIARYTQLFQGGSWAKGEDEADTVPFISAFKTMIQAETGQAFDAHPRIRELVTMLRLVEPSQQFTMMTIEPNEFKERPVLPAPTEIVPPDR